MNEVMNQLMNESRNSQSLRRTTLKKLDNLKIQGRISEDTKGGVHVLCQDGALVSQSEKWDRFIKSAWINTRAGLVFTTGACHKVPTETNNRYPFL